MVKYIDIGPSMDDVSWVANNSPGPNQPGHSLPGELPLPQRHHLQPGALQLRLVVRVLNLSLRLFLNTSSKGST